MVEKTLNAYVGLFGGEPCVVSKLRKTAIVRFRERFDEDVWERLLQRNAIRLVKAKITWEDK